MIVIYGLLWKGEEGKSVKTWW